MAPTRKRLGGSDPWDLPHHSESQAAHPARWQRFAVCPRKHISSHVPCIPGAFIRLSLSPLYTLSLSLSHTHTHTHTATPTPNLNNCLFSMGQMAKNLPANAGDPGSIPWAGKIPWRREVATSLQNSRLENPMDRGVWQGFSAWDRRLGKD